MTAVISAEFHVGRPMRIVNLSTGVVAASILISFGLAYAAKAQDASPGGSMQSTMSLGQDVAIPMGGIEVVCTGVGSSGDDPKWQSWPIRVVFSNSVGQFLANKVAVKITSKGKDLADFACQAPWVLVRGPAGKYQVSGSLDGNTKVVNFTLPQSSQKRVEISFPGQ